MDKETLQQLADWLEFFRDLGIESVYERSPEHGPCNLESQISNSALAGTAAPASGPKIRVPIPPLSSPSYTGSAGAGFRAGPRDPELRVPAESGFHRPVERENLGAPSPPASQARTSTMPPGPSLTLFGETGKAGQKPEETLEAIRDDLGDCRRCKLCGGRKHIVFGQGNPHAELVFVGEGPGADEDEQGLPFVGRAGQLLNRMLQLVGIKREDVYICNVVKCRPPANRTPEADEISACSPFLFRQIQAIHPRLVCCLGAPAAKTVLGIKEGITRIHGRLLDYGSAKAMATVHPAYVLRNAREEVILREDFEKIRGFLSQK
jgi:uracil-DNA glycosylase family 4